MKTFIVFLIGVAFGGLVYGWYKPMVERSKIPLCSEMKKVHVGVNHCKIKT